MHDLGSLTQGIRFDSPTTSQPVDLFRLDEWNNRNHRADPERGGPLHGMVRGLAMRAWQDFQL